MQDLNPVMGRIRTGARFFAAKNGEVVSALKFVRFNTKTVVGRDEVTGEEIAFDRVTGISKETELKVVYAGPVPYLYDKLVSDTLLWVQTMSPARMLL